MARRRLPMSQSSGSTSGSSGSPGSSFRSSRMNFRPTGPAQDERRGGTKPTSSPSSVGLVLTTMVIHVCKKSLLFDARLKVAIYCAAIFVVSLVADYATMPRTYFSRSDNVFNRYFVKWGWAWLLTVTVPWIALTARTLGCGKRPIVVRHLCRLLVATLAWILWIRFFIYVENTYGRCLNTKEAQLRTKAACLQAGKFWSGFDISGHTFILIYSSLILAEEGSTIVGWEGIKDLVVREEHSRNAGETSTGHLRNLASEDLTFLKVTHKSVTPYLRALFVGMTLQQILWDVMLAATLLYYHIMLEKMIGGLAAIVTWYATYHWWFKLANGGICSPGEGLFKYTTDNRENHDSAPARSRRNTLNGHGPRFMGLPIRTPQENPESSTNSTRIAADDLPRFTSNS